MRRLKNAATAGALVGAAILGGTVISSTFASTAPTADDGTSMVAPAHPVDEAYLDAYLDTLAAELGVERSALGPAALAAAGAAIDAAVTSGDIAADVGATLKERLASLEDPERLLVGRGALGGHRGPGGPGHAGFGPGLALGEAADAAAGALGIERDVLVEAFRDGTSLDELAAQEGVDYATVRAAVLEAVRARLADEVADEDLTQERADAILARLGDWLDDGGEPPAFRPGLRGAFKLGG